MTLEVLRSRAEIVVLGDKIKREGKQQTKYFNSLENIRKLILNVTNMKFATHPQMIWRTTWFK
jgi:hypothetical protein